MTNVPLYMRLYNSLSVAPLNGKHPFINAYNNTPDAHMSAGGPAYSSLVTIYGAM